MNEYNFKILNPQKTHSAEETELLNSLYQVWKNTFTEVLSAKNGKVDPDDFFRQQVLFALFENDKIIGFNFGTVFDFNLTNHLEHHFIHGLTEEAIHLMREQDIHRVLTLEYSTVMPEWRRHHSNIPWAEVLIAMALLYNDHVQIADAVIGTPRTDIKMDRAGRNVGYEVIKETIVKMDYPCSVVASKVKRKRSFTTLLTHKMAHYLWDTRLDLTMPQTQKEIQKTITLTDNSMLHKH